MAIDALKASPAMSTSSLPAPTPASDIVAELNLRILRLERRLEREKIARAEAEAIAERGLRELYDKQQHLALLEKIATAANTTSSIDDTLRFAVVEICAATGWAVGHVFKPSAADPGRLVATPIWHVASATLQPFIDITQASDFTFGCGLPGIVAQSGEPAWIEDVTASTNFPRAPYAQTCGLRAAFAFPVLIGDQVAAVMEFFFWEALAVDAALLRVMAQIGTQLGRVIERKRAEDKLIHDASHDPLTALPNRLLFLDRLSRAIVRHKRSAQALYAVLFIDLDRFKLVNDSLGHGAGDALLIEIGRRLQAALADRSPNSAEPVHTLARLAGDEFTALLEELAGPDDALGIARRLQEALRAPIMIGTQEVYTSASIGVALCRTDYACAEDILRDADLAMYRAKALGRGRVEVYTERLHTLAMERLRLESDLRRALHDETFALHYQPIVALGTRDIVGFEALVRWQRTPTTLVNPADFIGVAEETGLIVFIGHWVLREACLAVARWQSQFVRERPLTMSVNVSPRQLQQPDFVALVRQAVQDAGIAPATLRLEVTESVTIGDTGNIVQVLNELRAFGVRMSIDDFGTGYSSLSYLQTLPFDTLKIDRSFVAALSANAEGREIIQTILDLARSLKMEVVAEGTEIEADVDQLRDMGCDFAQGFYFSRPVVAEEVTRLLAAGEAPVAARLALAACG